MTKGDIMPMRAKFGLSLSNRAVLFGWATTEQLQRCIEEVLPAFR
jgi:hypothetical protein